MMENNSVGFQYFSDIHSEFFKNEGQLDNIDIQPSVPYLIIAGDIGNVCGQYQIMYEKFLKLVCNGFYNIW